MRKNVLMIYNPKAGTEKAASLMPKAVQYLCRANCRVVTWPILPGFGAEEIIQEEEGNFDIVVCCGGDGTLNHTINGLMRLDNRPLLGYIPSGSTNDFASSMDIKARLKDNCNAIATAEPFYYDIGKFNDKYFNYVAAFGAFTDVPYTTAQSSKNRMGHWAYIVEGLTHLPLGKYYHLTATANGKVYTGDYVYGSISNTTSIGGMSIQPLSTSTPDDGLYEVILIKNPTNFIELQGLIAAILVQNFDNPYIDYFKTDKIDFAFDSPTAWTLDGEFGDEVADVNISVENRAMGLLK